MNGEKRKRKDKALKLIVSAGLAALLLFFLALVGIFLSYAVTWMVSLLRVSRPNLWAAIILFAISFAGITSAIYSAKTSNP